MSQSRFNTVFLAQRVSLLRTLQRMVDNPSTAEDLLQETYLRVSGHWANGRSSTLNLSFSRPPATWPSTTCARRAQSRNLVDDVPEQVLHNVAAPSSSAEDATHAEQLLKRLSVSLGQLTSRQQRIFILSRLHGASYLEIAEQLNVSASTVQKELKLIMAICVGVANRLNRD